jgi:hypothetical protein
MNLASVWGGVAAIVICGFAIAASAQEPRPQLAQAPASGAVLGSAQFGADPDLRCDLLEVKRVSGGALTIRWRVVNGTAAPGGLTGAAGKKIHYGFSWEDLYYIDPAENKKYQFLTDSAGHRILDVYEGEYAPGQQRIQWAKFPAPPASSTKISIAIPKFAPFEDIPISP